MRANMPEKADHDRKAGPFTEKRFLICLLIVFIAMTIWVESLPYDPMNGDIADATTNAIWAEYYAEGKFAVTYDQWTADGQPMTQSVVVMLGGKAYVVNEKGPAHAMFIVVLGHAVGTVFAAIATVSTYMLGRRMFGWKVGAVASIFVLTNLSLVCMWYKDYWVDASTVHLLALSIFLFVESGIRMKAFLERKDRKAMLQSFVLGIGGGVALGASVATRYTVAVVVIPVVVYVFAIFFKHMVRSVRKKDLRAVGKNFANMTLYLLPLVLGLLIVLVPLMNYNNTYFGGPFRSGYDATTLQEYAKNHGSIAPRNQTDYLSTNPLGKAEIIWHNAVALAPVVILRMMFLIFVPVAMWKLWKRPIFFLLFVWGILIMLGFYSMSWVDKYAKIPPIPWEPRYQMPALVPFALLAAQGLCTLARAIENNTGRSLKGIKGPVFALFVTGLIVFLQVAPMEQFFKDVRDGKDVGAQQGGKPPGGQPDKPPLLTIEQLHTDGLQLTQKLVAVQKGTVVSIVNDSQGNVVRFEFSDPTSPPNMTVRPADWPQGAFPAIKVGSKVTVIGMFSWHDGNGNQIIDPGEPFIGVKFGTRDSVIIEK